MEVPGTAKEGLRGGVLPGDAFGDDLVAASLLLPFGPGFHPGRSSWLAMTFPIHAPGTAVLPGVQAISPGSPFWASQGRSPAAPGSFFAVGWHVTVW